MTETRAMNALARRMFGLVEPIGVIPYSADEPNEAMFALGFTNYWDTYFAGRAAPLGIVPASRPRRSPPSWTACEIAGWSPMTGGSLLRGVRRSSVLKH